MWALVMVPRGDLAEMKMRLLVSKGLVWGLVGGRCISCLVYVWEGT